MAKSREACSQLSLLQKRPCHRRGQNVKKSTKEPGIESRPEYNPLHTELQTPSVKVLVKEMKYKTDLDMKISKFNGENVLAMPAKEA